MQPVSRSIARTARLGVFLVRASTAWTLFAAIGACDDPSDILDPPPPSAGNPSALVSEPLAAVPIGATVASRDAMAVSEVPEAAVPAERIVYVSLPSGSYQAGSTAMIRNTAGGPTFLQSVVDGGFDPVAVSAGVGDTVAIEILGDGRVLAQFEIPVLRSKRPEVVRTRPPKGKRDIALNSRATVIFSEPIDANSANSSSIVLSRGGMTVPGSVRVFAGGLAAEFIPSAPLARQTVYGLVITQSVTDLDGDPLAAGMSVEFTTGDSAVPPVTQVEVTPPSATLEAGDVIGEVVQLSATVRGDAGVLTDRELIWSTSDPSIAVVSNTGLVTARGPGVAVITATSEGRSGVAQITVVPTPVARINIGPLNPAVGEGGTIVLHATTFDRNDRLVSGRQRLWQSSAAHVASVDQRGLVTGLEAGTTTVTVTSEGIVGTTTVAVGGPVLVDRIAIDPPSAAIRVGETTEHAFRAFRCDAEINGCAPVTGQAVSWSSSDTTVATVDVNGRLTATRPGTVAITARIDGITGLAPVTVLPPSPLAFTAIAAGNQSTCAVTAAGTPYCWGDNFFGQLGTGELGIGSGSRPSWTPAAVAPVAVSGGHSFTSIGSGSWHACGLTIDSDAHCWGKASSARLGQPVPADAPICEVAQQSGTSRPACVPFPIPVLGALPAFGELSAGTLHTCGLTTGAEVYCWGGDHLGQVGDGGGVTAYGITPVRVALDRSVASLSAGAWHTCAVTMAGEAFCWGSNITGQLGDGSTANRDRPVAVASEIPFASVSAGLDHSCALAEGGDAFCWGDNFYGQLGDGSHTSSTIPVKVRGGPFARLDAGSQATCGLTVSGTAYCWGANWDGRLGDGTLSSRSTPVTVAGGLAFSAITLGTGHACGLTTDNVAYCWGWNLLGQLGDGSSTDRLTPVRVAGQP